MPETIRVLIRTTIREDYRGDHEIEMRVVGDLGIPEDAASGPVDTYRRIEQLFGNLAGETRVVVLQPSGSIPGLYTEGGI